MRYWKKAKEIADELGFLPDSVDFASLSWQDRVGLQMMRAIRELMVGDSTMVALKFFLHAAITMMEKRKLTLEEIDTRARKLTGGMGWFE